MENKKIKIALVNQRYGMDVNGGSEYYTRQLAEHLKKYYEVEVLTTKAQSYDTWKDFYSQDVEKINNVTVRRFHVEKTRSVFGMRVLGKLRRFFPFLKEYWEDKWIDAQGPYSPELIHYIKENKDNYNLFIFVTYLYYHTVRGIPEVADRAVLLPTAHDEPYIYYNIFDRVFSAPLGLIYLTPEEKRFVESRFSVQQKPNCITGAGVELPENISSSAYRQKYNITEEYLIYVGRIDLSKGCDVMFRIFQEYKNQHPDSKLKLILMGKVMMEIPDDPDVIYQGFVSEEDKFNGISGARALWLPSQFESLSIAVLESMALGVPVLVNGTCEVLKGHCVRSRAGIAYDNQNEAVSAIDMLLDDEKCVMMKKYARKYIDDNYQWNVIIDKMQDFIQNWI